MPSGADAMSLHTRMLLGFVVGVVGGLFANGLGADSSWLEGLITYVTQPVGDLFLRSLFMLVVPLVFSALVLGVVEIGDPAELGRIGGKTLLYIVVVTTAAVTIGRIGVNEIRPGGGLTADGEIGRAHV